ncbi:TPR domain-containing protein [Reticulomyxa filosa]|uniref:TPR domain-containing protein n=1 Tax=Reticulomyxa filosa TaxID=46433 RepID=X6NMR3_RETFI|nr:TPR domain-containing protein [Reticulomyxa filosa]|eukprot:ETO26692.1 TPR domain-containing protein [Reticulomyxa filosa]
MIAHKFPLFCYVICLVLCSSLNNINIFEYIAKKNAIKRKKSNRATDLIIDKFLESKNWCYFFEGKLVKNVTHDCVRIFAKIKVIAACRLFLENYQETRFIHPSFPQFKSVFKKNESVLWQKEYCPFAPVIRPPKKLNTDNFWIEQGNKKHFIKFTKPKPINVLSYNVCVNSRQKSKVSANSQMHIYLLGEGNKNLQQDNTLQSINNYEQALQVEKTSEGYTKRAFAYFHIKDYKNAMADALTAIKMNPQSVEGYIAVASVQIALEEHSKALEYLITALELTNPLDPCRASITEVMTGCKIALKTQQAIDQRHQTQGTPNQKESTSLPASETLPFENDAFLYAQRDVTQQMTDKSGDVFLKKLERLNQLPAIQRLQSKILRGEAPTPLDCLELMKDPQFKQFNLVMTKMSKHPKFEKAMARFAKMDLMGAYQQLQQDPEALSLFMRALDAIDKKY